MLAARVAERSVAFVVIFVLVVVFVFVLAVMRTALLGIVGQLGDGHAIGM